MKTFIFLLITSVLLWIISCSSPRKENSETGVEEIQLAEKSMKEFEDFRSEIIPNIENFEEEIIKEDDPAKEIKNKIGVIRKTCSEDVNKPTKIEELTGGYDVFYSSFDENIAASLKLIPYGSISGKDRSIVVVYNFLQYKDDYCNIDNKDYPVLWGSGVQMTLHIKSRKRNLKTTAMAGLAAAVDYNRAHVEYRLKTIGIIGDPVRFRVATQGEFNVDNYAKIISNVDEIIRLMGDSAVTITPQLIVVGEEL